MSQSQDTADHRAALPEVPSGAMCYETSRIWPNCSPQRAFDTWITQVWLGGGGFGRPRILNTGDKFLVGNLRQVGGGVKEEILFSDKESKVIYRVKSGFPVHFHRGTVTFTAMEGHTRILWRCEFVPFRFLGFMVDLIIRVSFWWMLRNTVVEKKV